MVMSNKTKTSLAVFVISIIVGLNVAYENYGSGAFLFSFTLFNFLVKGFNLTWKGKDLDE